MELLKLRISKKRELLLLGYYNDYKIWQVIKKRYLRKDIYNSYFLAVKNNKKIHVRRKSSKIAITKYFASTISFIALKLAKNVNIINYIGKFDHYHIWEAWIDDSEEDFSSIFIFFNYDTYMILKDKNKIEDIKAYLLVQKAYKL